MDWTSWSKTYLIDKEYDDIEQETSDTQTEVFALKTEAFAFASRSKAKAKPQRRTPASSSTKTVLVGESTWTDIEPEDYSPIAYPMSKQLSTLLRHGHLLREDDGAIEFWRLKGDLRNKFGHSQLWSNDMCKSKMAGGGGNKKRLQYCTDPSGQEILYLRGLQGHSGRKTHWSFTTGQCRDSGRFLQVHFITLDVQSVYIPSQIQDW